MKRPVKTALVLIALTATAVAVVVAARRAEWFQVRPVTPEPHAAVAGIQFVGSQACRQCHSDIYERYQQTGMAQSWRSIDATNLSRFDSGNAVPQVPSGFVYDASLNGGRPEISESRNATPLAPEHRLNRPVHFAIGSGSRAQAYATETGGYLTLAPINWYAEKQAWDLNPGYERSNQRFDRPVLAECAACHHGNARRLTASVNRFEQPIAAGIGCEACHGPGARHVAEQAGASRVAFEVTPGSDTIVNPARLEPARQNDVCFNCHLAADVRWSRPVQTPPQFQPGLRLADYRADFFVTPDNPESVGVASHGARMVQSRCFTESDGRLTCILCHDPHEPAGATPRATYDQRCAECHELQDCPKAVAAAQHLDESASCVRCHMPAVPAGNAPHVVFTDHWIRSRPASRSSEIRAATKPKREPGRPVELTDFWSREPSAADRGIAYVSYYDQTPDSREMADLEHGLTLLKETRSRDKTWPADASFWLGIGHGHRGEWKPAIAALEQAARSAQDEELAAEARSRLAAAYLAIDRPDRAEATFRELLRTRPDRLEMYEGLVPLLAADNRLDEAIELCRSSLERNRNQPAIMAQLAFALVRKNRATEEPLALLREARELNPDSGIAYLTLAAVAEMAGDSAGSRRARRDAMTAMARSSLSAGDRAGAVAIIEQAVKDAPTDAALREWLAELKSAAADSGF